MNLDAAKEGGEIRDLLDRTEGNKDFADKWLWRNAKVIGLFTQSVVVPARDPDSTPDLELMPSHKLSTATDIANTTAGYKPVSWKILLPTVSSFRDPLVQIFELYQAANLIPKTSEQNQLEMIYQNSVFRGALLFNAGGGTDSALKGALLHELKHSTGASEGKAFRPEWEFVNQKKGAGTISDDAILLHILKTYGFKEMGKAVAELTNGSIDHPLYKRWKPDGTIFKSELKRLSDAVQKLPKGGQGYKAYIELEAKSLAKVSNLLQSKILRPQHREILTATTLLMIKEDYRIYSQVVKNLEK